MTNFNQINWSKIWETKMKKASGVASWSENGAERGVNRWENAKDRPNRLGDIEYYNKLFNKLSIKSDDSVLNIGCGSDLLSILIAKKANKVTALDISFKMLEKLKKIAQENGIKNIDYMQSDWQFVKPEVDVPMHDIVIASRCMGMFDLEDELIKINNITKKRAYITRIVEEKDLLSPRIYGLLGREFQPLPSYYYIYNLLYQLGIQANLDYISVDVEEKYENINHAIDVWRWKLKSLEKEGELKLKNFLEDNLICLEDNKWTTGLFNCQWALISWTANKGIRKNLEKNYNRIFSIPDWNNVWANLPGNKAVKNKKPFSSEKWDIFAHNFNQGVMRDWNNKNSYINQLINKIQVNIHDTVLDIGCASGGISIPIAEKAESVTSIDISSEMISYLKEHMLNNNITNINSVLGDWENIVSNPKFPKHDIVIASRCLSGSNLMEKLIKINNIASKRVYFTWIIKISNLQKSIYNILNRDFYQEPEYIYIFNLLQSISINPKISFIYCQGTETFLSIEDAMQHYKWILQKVTEKEKTTLYHYFKNNYIRKEDDRIESPTRLNSEWAWVVFSWEKQE